ncbi:MAG: class I SAM-dependent RNA methyltransferase [Clostridia bacterium]|nr:class I SAM-dependent RNA methyltransferase [Clostridia bacterium]
MEQNEILRLAVTDTNENGVGIARHEGMVVFVPGLLAGEEADVRITSLEKNYAAGICLCRQNNAPERIADDCPSADVCGGCTLGFTTYEHENRIKENTVRAALRRAGLCDSRVRTTVSAPERCFYRNKIVVHYDAASASFGFVRAESNDPIPFAGCLLAPPAVSRIIRYANGHPALFSPLSPTELHLRTAPAGITLSLYAGTADRDAFSVCRDALTGAFDEISDVLLFPTQKSAASKTSAPVYIRDRIAGLDMRFTSEAFRQVNTPAFEKLLGIVHDFAAEKPFSCAADLYCGSGIIGLSLAKRFPDARFWGIEINPDAVRDAKLNAEHNGLANITFFCGDAATFRTRLGRKEHPELLVVDPPRAGLSKEMRRGLLSLSPERIIYVSCNPQTMARDLAALCASDGNSPAYELREAVPVNMFPRTKHCETVAWLTRKDA